MLIDHLISVSMLSTWECSQPCPYACAESCPLAFRESWSLYIHITNAFYSHQGSKFKRLASGCFTSKCTALGSTIIQSCPFSFVQGSVIIWPTGCVQCFGHTFTHSAPNVLPTKIFEKISIESTWSRSGSAVELRISIGSELSFLNFDSSVRAEQSFAIRYPNVVIM